MTEFSDNKIKELSIDLKSKKKVAVLTGAGISTDSGIPDFRSESGVYSKWDSAKVFDLDYFKKNPGYFYEYARNELFGIKDKKPNSTHYLLGKLEEMGIFRQIITQNIDMLHQKAGNRNVIELHGSIEKSFCLKCGKCFSADDMLSLLEKTEIPVCTTCGGFIKPNIVFFGENLPENAIEDAFKLAEESEIFVAMGSSLSVYPAASLPMQAKRNGAKVYVISRGKTNADYYSDCKIDMDFKTFTTELNNCL